MDLFSWLDAPGAGDAAKMRAVTGAVQRGCGAGTQFAKEFSVLLGSNGRDAMTEIQPAAGDQRSVALDRFDDRFKVIIGSP
jgi:hypothetical protein